MLYYIPSLFIPDSKASSELKYAELYPKRRQGIYQHLLSRIAILCSHFPVASCLYACHGGMHQGWQDAVLHRVRLHACIGRKQVHLHASPAIKGNWGSTLRRSVLLFEVAIQVDEIRMPLWRCVRGIRPRHLGGSV